MSSTKQPLSTEITESAVFKETSTGSEGSRLALSAQQRRGHQRYPVDLAVELAFDSNLSRGRTENLSARGAFVVADGGLRVGDALDVTITLPTDEKVVVRGIARWLREYLEPDGPRSGAGVEFVDVEGEQALLAFLEGRDSLVPDID